MSGDLPTSNVGFARDIRLCSEICGKRLRAHARIRQETLCALYALFHRRRKERKCPKCYHSLRSLVTVVFLALTYHVLNV
jgi:hypothetical protein